MYNIENRIYQEMDSTTGERLAALRDSEDLIREQYASRRPANTIADPYRGRFKAIGARIMKQASGKVTCPAEDSVDGFARKGYERTAQFSPSLFVKLIADTILDTDIGESLDIVRAVIVRNNSPRDLNDPIAVETLGTDDFAFPSIPIEMWAKLRALEDTLDTVDSYQSHQVNPV
jgi:hypothetical protein